MEKKQIEYFLSCGIKRTWHGKTHEDFVNDPEAYRKVKSYLSKVHKAQQDGIGLYLYGANGTGKSLLLNLIAMELISMRKTVHVIGIEELVDTVTASWYNNDIDVDRIKNVDFLFIDEFGKNLDADGNPVRLPDLVKRIVESIIRYRVQMNKPILIASNTDAKYVKEVFSEDIASLLNEAVIPILVKGKDFRKTIQARIKEEYL